MTPCPDDEALIRYVDGALSVEETERLDEHLGECARCRERRALLRRLIADVKAPVGPEIDVHAHVQGVMDRLDRPTSMKAPPRARWVWTSVGAGAVCAFVAVLVAHAPRGGHGWQARGGPSEAALGRDVLVRPCVAGSSLEPLAAGSVIERDAPLTATFRNLGTAPAYLLLFAVDAQHVVHWIAPRYSRPEENPVARTLPPSVRQDVLDTSAVFDDVSPGALRLVAVVSSAPIHVADVETLEARELDQDRLGSHFPRGTDVRETIVQVRGGGSGGAR
jgi:anti-sigma factor RsiW